MTRGEGGSWPQPGDPLHGQPTSYLSRVAGQAATDAWALDRTPLDALRIDTDGHTAGEAADLTAAAARWPGQGQGPEIPASRHLTDIWSGHQTTAGAASRAKRARTRTPAACSASTCPKLKF
jgi:hypothetical protein